MFKSYEAYQIAYSSRASKNAKLVISYLIWRSDSEGKSFPSKATIARDCSMSVRAVDLAINELVELGLIEKTNRWRTNTNEYTSNEYRVIIPSSTANNEQPTANITQPDPVKVTQNVRTNKKEIYCISNRGKSNNNKESEVVVKEPTKQDRESVVVDPLLEFIKEQGLDVSRATIARWRRKLSVAKILSYLKYAIEVVCAQNPIAYVNAAICGGYDPTQNRVVLTRTSRNDNTDNGTTSARTTAPRKKVRSAYLERLRAGGAR